MSIVPLDDARVVSDAQVPFDEHWCDFADGAGGRGTTRRIPETLREAIVTRTHDALVKIGWAHTS